MSMQMADELIEVIAEARKLHIKKPGGTILYVWRRCSLAAFIKYNHARKMDGAHARDFCTLFNTLKFVRCEADIELLISWF
jgi:hypothetical protein